MIITPDEYKQNYSQSVEAKLQPLLEAIAELLKTDSTYTHNYVEIVYDVYITPELQQEIRTRYRAAGWRTVEFTTNGGQRNDDYWVIRFYF